MKEIKISENESEQRLDRFLRKLLKNIPLKEIYKYIRKGIVKVNGKKVKENYMLQLNDIVTLYIENIEFEKTYKRSFEEINIVYEDDNILILDKPVGLLCHPESSKDKDTLVQRVLGHVVKSNTTEQSLTFSPALCNRLDRNTSGLIIAAKNYDALKSVNEMIREKGLIKYYLCIVKGSTKDKGEINIIIGKDQEKRMAYLADSKKFCGKKAKTRYIKLADNGDYSLLKVELATGRFHQIRAHLSGINHPIIGDTKYGDNEINDFFSKKYSLKYQFLIAYSLYFKNPLKSLEYLKGKTWHSDIPKDFAIIIKSLFGDLKDIVDL